MPNTDVMLRSGTAASRGILQLGGDYVVISELTERARELQAHGMQQKLNGDHKGAVLTYRALLQVVRALDDLNAFSWPKGLSTQLTERAIELEQDAEEGQCLTCSQPPPAENQ